MPSAEPSDCVTFIFQGLGGHMTGMCRLEYTGGRLVQYFRTTALKPHGLVQRTTTKGARNRSGQKVRLTYIPCSGDVIVVG